MSEHEHEQSTDEEREETIQDLDVPEEQGEDVAGGKKSQEGWKDQ
ncbi:MAG TPA: hypothetical protein VH420_04410 [Gaiellaceae bacterium]|jgi:hypothetical protein